MPKKVKKGKNAQKKKTQRNRNVTSVRSTTVSVAQQRAMYEEQEPRAELGAGVKVRSKGTTMPLGVRILVGLMAFTMLTMMGVVSYSSLNDFDIIDWLTGEDVAPGTTSPTDSASAMTSTQRAAIDATNKFDGFFVVDEDSGLTLTDVNSNLQTSDTVSVTTKYKKDAEKKRDEILESDKDKIQSLQDKKDARDEAKRNNPFKKFSDGLSELRDAVVALFTNTYDGLTGKNRATNQDYSDLELDEENPDLVDSEAPADYNEEATAEASDSEAVESNESEAESDEDANNQKADTDADGSDTKSLDEALAEASGTAVKSGTGDKTLAEELNESNS